MHTENLIGKLLGNPLLGRLWRGEYNNNHNNNNNNNFKDI